MAEASLVEHEVSLVQTEEGHDFNFDVTFVGAAECLQTSAGTQEVMASGLVSSPGFGIVDSGCGCALIGKETLFQYKQKLADFTDKPVDEYETANVLRYGNGATEVSPPAVRLPVAIGGRRGLIDPAVIEGRAPLLLGRPTLERLGACLDFAQKEMKLLDLSAPLRMIKSSAGQLLIDVLDFHQARSQTSTGSSGGPCSAPLPPVGPPARAAPQPADL